MVPITERAVSNTQDRKYVFNSCKLKCDSTYCSLVSNDWSLRKQELLRVSGIVQMASVRVIS